MLTWYETVVGKWVLNSPWWRHEMEAFSALLAFCAGNSPVPGEFPAQRPVTRSFNVFFDLRLNKPLSKQWWGWWLETPWCPLWRHCNARTLLFWMIYYSGKTSSAVHCHVSSVLTISSGITVIWNASWLELICQDNKLIATLPVTRPQTTHISCYQFFLWQK